MNFVKKVVYLSFLEDGIKGKSVGYIRIEKRDHLLSIDMHINAKGLAPGGKYEILAESGESPVPVGMIYLQNGAGGFQGEFPAGEVGRKGYGLAYEDIVAFRVVLDERRAIVGKLNPAGGASGGGFRAAIPSDGRMSGDELRAVPLSEVKMSGDELRAAPLSDARMSGDELRVAPSAGGRRSGNESGATALFEGGFSYADLPYDGGKETEASSESRASQAGRRPFVQAHDEDVRRKLEEVRLTPGKWQQLLKNYRPIHPYGDERLYIAIEPRDFVIMSGEYQHLAHNSFLLHGFYNYRHIIMGEENDGYYLGVPGVFYEREKMVAMMFGFEAFECEGGKAENGKFGYYLKKVKI